MDAKFLEYNCLDSACTLECHNKFWDDLHPDFDPAYQMSIDLLPVISFMQTRGIKVNIPALKETQSEILASAAEKQTELNKLCGRDLNVNSPKACQTYFYVELGIPPYYNEGSITVDDLALQRMVRGTAKHPGLRQAKLVQDIRGLQKLNNTYLDMEFDSDNRMRCSFNVRGTKFGRLSSSKTIFGTGGNFQNLHPDFKKFLEPDGIFVEIDKARAEWVVVAYLSGDANMLAAIEQGKDIHAHTASLMFELELELIEYESRLVGHASDPDIINDIRSSDSILARFAPALPRTMSGRQAGKKAGHGLNYGEGPNKFALTNEIEIPEARRLVELYHSVYPGIRSWYEVVKRQLQKDRTLTNCFGRKVRFMDAWGDDLWKTAYSFLPQSTVVDSLNQGMIKIYDDDWISRDCDVSIAAQVHDSILLDVPLDVFKHNKFQEILTRAHDYVSPDLKYNGRTFKIATDTKVGLNWGGASKTNPLGMRALKNVLEIPEILSIWNVA